MAWLWKNCRLYPILLVVILAACSGDSDEIQQYALPNDSAGQTELTGWLPKPSTLRTASATTTRLFRWGQGYGAEMPHNCTSQTGVSGTFMPHWMEAEATADDLAYACYSFNTTGFTGESKLHFTWTQTGNYADAWVALSDWTHNRWRWYQLTDSNVLAYTPAENVSASGDLLVAVLLTGTAQWKLESLYIEQPAETWNVFGGNLQRTRCAPVNGPQSPTQKWAVVLPCAPSLYDPVLGSNGAIYVSGSADGTLYAITPDGTLAWSYVMDEEFNVRASPAVGQDGTIYVGTWNKFFYAINPDGTLRWKIETDDFIEAGALVDANGLIYFGSDDGFVYAVNPDGSIAWEFYAGGMIYAGPTFSADGHIYAANTDGMFYCLTGAGLEDWTYNAGLTIWGPAAVASDGSIYFGSRNENIYALNPDGSEKWTYATGGWVWSSAAICPDGTVVMGNKHNGFTALSPDGDLKWTHSGHECACATIGADGTVYCTGYEGNYESWLYALNPATGAEKWKLAGCNGCPAIGPDGTLYVGGTTTEGEYCLYAIGE